MKTFFVRHRKGMILICIGCSVAFAAGLLLVYLDTLPYKPIGSVDKKTIDLAWLLSLVLSIPFFLMRLSCFLLAPCLFVAALCFRRHEKIFFRCIALGIIGVAFILAPRTNARLYGEYPLAIFPTVEQQAQPIIDALDQYREEHGEYPGELEDLIPDHIQSFPDTGAAGFPHFDYDPYESEELTYELYVNLRTSFGEWRFFTYCPQRVYPDQMGGVPLERIGNWGYVHHGPKVAENYGDSSLLPET